MKALLLEDDPELGPAVADGLRDHGIVVDLVTTIADADLQLAMSTYDCIVLDRRVPDGDALSLVQTMRGRGDTSPTLVLTARGAVSDRVDGFARGADDYLAKPFAFPELVARVRALGRRRDTVRATVVTAGDLVLDVPRHRITRGGVRLTLTAKEFAVLEVLMEDPGVAVSRGDLLERCWDEMSAPGSNVVDVLVGQLRRHLGDPDPIETVRGVGYRLRVPGDR